MQRVAVQEQTSSLSGGEECEVLIGKQLAYIHTHMKSTARPTEWRRRRAMLEGVAVFYYYRVVSIVCLT